MKVDRIGDGLGQVIIFQHNFCVKPYAPREPRSNPINRRLNEPGIYIWHCQESNSQPVPSQAVADHGWSARLLYWLKYMLQKEDKFARGPACCCLFVMWSIWLQNHKKVKMYIISIARRAIKELSETNIIWQDRYYRHLAHFQYTSF